MRYLGRLILAATILLIADSRLSAQEISASIRGSALDGSGATVSGVKITATQSETGLKRTAISDAHGAYVLVELPVGHYLLEAESQGFKKYVQQGISLDVNQTANVVIRLAVGLATQEIQVLTDAPLVESTATNLGKTVQEREILDLPLNGRNFTQLGLLQPGVAPLTPGLQAAGGSLRDGQAYAVNGQRPESNNFLIDGADNINNVDGGFVLKPPVDAIAEFRILTHTANAEFGRNSGSTTNIITRSGTNSFHGALWEFLRNDMFDAKSFFADSVEPLKRNQFGGTFGGPVRRDKTFFFIYYEGLRNRQGETRESTVPSVPERSGDFGDLCPMGFDSNGVCNDPSFAHGHQIYNVFVPPNTPPQPIPYNKLPGINPISQNLLPFYPLPNVGANTFLTTQNASQDGDQFGLRFDHYLTSRDTLNFRYSFSQVDVTDPLSPDGANVPGFPVGGNERAQNFVAQETHTFSPSLVAVGRFSYLRNKLLFDQHLNHTDPANFGFTYQPTLAAAFGPPFIQIAGFASIGDPITGPRNTYENNFDFNGSVTWIHGQHELKFGGGYSYDQVNMLFGIASNGFFVFVNAPLTNPLASFLIGQPIFFLQGGGDFHRGLRGHSLNTYVQDTFKLSSHLTLNYGLRYELPFPYTEIHNRMNLFEPGVQSTVMPTAPAGLVYPGDHGVPRGLIPAEKTAFAPRVGLAWDPTGRGMWHLSASYGIFYDPYYNGQGGITQDPVSAPPYLQTPSVQVPNFADPFNGSNPFASGFSKPMTLLTIDKNLRLPYAQDWNLNVQRAFGSSWLAEIGYVGTKGTKLPRFIEGNPAVYVPGADSSGNPLSTAGNADQRRLYSGCTLQNNQPCVFSSAGLIAGISNSSYHALQSSLRKRFGHGLSFLGSYTLSKTIDDVSSFNITGSASQSTAGENDLAQNPFNLGAEKGRSMFDARHRFVLSYQWDLPFFARAEGWKRQILGGWQVNGITTFQTGTPFTVYDSAGVSLEGGAPEISGFPSDRPDRIGDFTKGTCTNSAGVTFQAGTPNCWISPAGFQRLDPVTQAGQFGNAGRNIAQGPGYQQWDFSALKNFRIAEGKTLQFRGELFNIFNHANLGLPQNDLNSPNFGEIQTSQPGRLVQFALKFLF